MFVTFKNMDLIDDDEDEDEPSSDIYVYIAQHKQTCSLELQRLTRCGEFLNVSPVGGVASLNDGELSPTSAAFLVFFGLMGLRGGFLVSQKLARGAKHELVEDVS